MPVTRNAIDRQAVTRFVKEAETVVAPEGGGGESAVPTLEFTSESYNEKADASVNEVGFNTRQKDGAVLAPYGSIVQNLTFQSKDATERFVHPNGLEIVAFHTQAWSGSISNGQYVMLLYVDRVGSTLATDINPIFNVVHFDSITVTPLGHAPVTFIESDFTKSNGRVVDQDATATTDTALKYEMFVPSGPITTISQMTAFNNALLSGQASLTVNGAG